MNEAVVDTERAELTIDDASPGRVLDVVRLTFQLQGNISALLASHAREQDLGSSEVIALIALLDGPTPISGVARAAGIRPNGASVLVDRLRTRKLVKRQRSRKDNRVVTVELTDTGRALATSLRSRLGDQLHFLLAPLGVDERDSLVTLMQRVLAA